MGNVPVDVDYLKPGKTSAVKNVPEMQLWGKIRQKNFFGE